MKNTVKVVLLCLAFIVAFSPFRNRETQPTPDYMSHIITAKDTPIAGRNSLDQIEAVRAIEAEADRLEAERIEAERREQERLEAERLEAERIEQERIEAEIEAERQRVLAEQAVLEPEPTVVMEEAVDPDPDPLPALTAEAELLARLVEAEAQGESYAGKVAVAEVVLNRVRSPQYPNSIEGVIYEAGQFSPVMDGRINMTPTAESYTAVAEAMAGSNYVGGALFFYNPAVATSRWLDGLPTIAVIGSHTFK